MKLAEAWRLSKIPYKETVYQSIAEERGRMWWGAFEQNHLDKEGGAEFELTKRALRIARFDKMLVSIFSIIVSIAPFATMLLVPGTFGLVSSVSLSLSVAFGLTTLYAIQTFSSFVSSGSSTLLSTMPISQNDFSLITLLSFIRSFDYIVLGSIASQVIAIAVLTASPLAALIMFAASSINSIFSITIALWFTRIFKRNLLRGGRSKANALLRVGFILIWGLLLVSVGFLFTLPWYIMPNFDNLLLGTSQIWTTILDLIYPFSTGLIITQIENSNVAVSTLIIASVALVATTLLAALGAKWTLKTAKNTTQNPEMKSTRATAMDLRMKTRSPIFGYIFKDLKVASRNPATAFFFALPVIETLIVTLLVSSAQAMKTAVVLDATLMGGVFALFLPLALLSAEGKGIEYTKTLPITSKKIIISKTLVSTATYFPVPIALAIMSLLKPLSAASTILIPVLTTAAVASASIFELKLFFKTTAKSKISALFNDLQKLVVGIFTIIIPEIAYGTVFLISLNHNLAITTMGGIVLAEIAVAAYVATKD